MQWKKCGVETYLPSPSLINFRNRKKIISEEKNRLVGRIEIESEEKVQGDEMEFFLRWEGWFYVSDYIWIVLPMIERIKGVELYERVVFREFYAYAVQRLCSADDSMH